MEELHTGDHGSPSTTEPGFDEEQDLLGKRHCTGTRTRRGRAHKDALTPKRPPEHTGRHRIASIQWSLASVTVALFLFPSSASAMSFCFRFYNTQIKQKVVKPALISIFFSHPRTGVPVLTPRGCLSSYCASISLDNAMPSIVQHHHSPYKVASLLQYLPVTFLPAQRVLSSVCRAETVGACRFAPRSRFALEQCVPFCHCTIMCTIRPRPSASSCLVLSN